VKLWRDYSLGIVLLVFFLVTLLLHGIASWMHYASTQEAHGQATETAGFIWQFGNEVFENWQSEALQLFLMVVLTTALVHRGSGEGKQNQEQADRIEGMQLKLEWRQQRIESKLDELLGRRP
jgi:hypothetical protein